MGRRCGGTLTQLLGLTITRRLALVGVLAMVGTAAVNVVRLVAATIIWSGADVKTRPAV